MENDLSLVAFEDLCQEIIRRSNKCLIIRVRLGKLTDSEPNIQIGGNVPLISDGVVQNHLFDVREAISLLKLTEQIFLEQLK